MRFNGTSSQKIELQCAYNNNIMISYYVIIKLMLYLQFKI